MNNRLRQKLRKRRHQLWRAVQADDLRRVRKLVRLGAGDIRVLLEDACVYASPEMLDLLREIAGLPADRLLVSRLAQAIENDDAVAVQQILEAGKPLFGEGVVGRFFLQAGEKFGIADADGSLLCRPQDGGSSAGFFLQLIGVLFDCVVHRQVGGKGYKSQKRGLFFL